MSFGNSSQSWPNATHGSNQTSSDRPSSPPAEHQDLIANILYSYISFRAFQFLSLLAIVRLFIARFRKLPWWQLDKQVFYNLLPLCLTKILITFTEINTPVDLFTVGGQFLFIPYTIVLSHFLLGTRLSRNRLMTALMVTAAYLVKQGLFATWLSSHTNLSLTFVGAITSLVLPLLKSTRAVLIKRCLSIFDISAIDLTWYTGIIVFPVILSFGLIAGEASHLRPLIAYPQVPTTAEALEYLKNDLIWSYPLLYPLIQVAFIKYTSPMTYMVATTMIDPITMSIFTLLEGGSFYPSHIYPSLTSIAAEVVVLIGCSWYLCSSFKELRKRRRAPASYIPLHSIGPDTREEGRVTPDPTFAFTVL